MRRGCGTRRRWAWRGRVGCCRTSSAGGRTRPGASGCWRSRGRWRRSRRCWASALTCWRSPARRREGRSPSPEPEPPARVRSGRGRAERKNSQGRRLRFSNEDGRQRRHEERADELSRVGPNDGDRGGRAELEDAGVGAAAADAEVQLPDARAWVEDADVAVEVAVPVADDGDGSGAAVLEDARVGGAGGGGEAHDPGAVGVHDAYVVAAVDVPV